MGQVVKHMLIYIRLPSPLLSAVIINIAVEIHHNVTKLRIRFHISKFSCDFQPIRLRKTVMTLTLMMSTKMAPTSGTTTNGRVL